MICKLAAWALVAATVGWGTAIMAAPLVRGAPQDSLLPRMAGGTYLVGALVCHQRPERSFHVAGAQLPVCARCAALYWGGAIGLVGWLLVRSGGGNLRAAGAPIKRTLFARAIFILGVPIAVTLATSALGVWDPANTVRAISSAPFGVALGALLAAVILKDLR